MQYTNVVAIDPSLSCTGICINGSVSCVTKDSTSKTKKLSYTKWFGMVDDVATITSVSDRSISCNYSEDEINKLSWADLFSDEILHQIKSNIGADEKTICIMEGYSYGSSEGHIINLVELSTLLRIKLMRLCFDILIVPPTTLKVSAAKLTYDPIDVGKRKPKLEWRNLDGVSGGKFKKHEMYKVIIENDTLQCDWKQFLIDQSDVVLNMANIPTPIDDINDAYLLYHTFINDLL